MTGRIVRVSGLELQLRRTGRGRVEITVEAARACLAQRFPDNLLTTLIERASMEATDRQSHYNALAAAGEWLW